MTWGLYNKKFGAEKNKNDARSVLAYVKNVE